MDYKLIEKTALEVFKKYKKNIGLEDLYSLKEELINKLYILTTTKKMGLNSLPFIADSLILLWFNRTK